MQSRERRTPARRVRLAGRLLAVQILALAFGGVAAGALTGAQDAKPGAAGGGAGSVVGLWHATLPNGLRTASLSIVPHGDGLAGTFVGYDYDRRIDFAKPIEGDPPKVTIRSGALLVDPRLDGNTLTFKMLLRPPGMPAGEKGFEITGEMKVQGGTGELKLSAPHKPEPLKLKLTRE